MSAQRFELIARVAKARGLEGKVTVHLADDLPFCLSEGLICHVVPPSLYGPRQLTIKQIDELGDGSIVIAFDEVGTIGEAEGLAGKNLLARVDDLDIAQGAFSPSWLARTVVDERYGELGAIVELIDTPAHEVWVIEGPYGEVLVPAVEEFVLDVGEDTALPIRTRIPDGLVDQPK